MKTFCIFSALYLPNLGGVERITHNMARHLVAKGHRVIIVTSNIFDMEDVEVSDGIKIYRMPCVKLLNGRFPVPKRNSLFRRLNKRLLNESIDYVVINTRFYLNSMYGARFSKKILKQGIIIEHGSGHFTVNSRFFDFLGHIFEHIITALIKKYICRFYGSSDASSKWLEHFGIQPCGIISNAIDYNEISKIVENSTMDFRYEYGINENDIIVTYTGRLIREKGALELSEAIRLLQNRLDCIHLFIAGDGDLLKELERFASSNVHLLGRIDFENVIALLSQSDIYCLPTYYSESFPTAVMEAAACGCFCITTTGFGTDEIIMSDEYGMLLDRAQITPESIADAIQKAAADPTYRKSAAEKAKQQVIENFRWEVVSQNVIDAFMLEEGEA